MPKLRLVGQNVSAARSQFCLIAFLSKAGEVPTGFLVVDLTAELEPVFKVEADGIDPGERFEYEQDIEGGVDLRLAQWAMHNDLRGRFLLHQLRWGDHELLRQPGIV